MKAKDFDDVLGEVDKEIKDTRKEIADARNKQMQMFGGKAHAAEKEKAEKKEIDYDAIFSRSFQAISSLLTITLLLKQL